MELSNFKFEIDSDGVALATFDLPGRSMNTLNLASLMEIKAITAEVVSNDAIKGLVFTSGKKSGFCAGADLGELGDGALTGGGSKEEQFKSAFSFNMIFRDLETCGKPVAAAINGLALGGGLELCLACHYRIAANDNPRIQLGLPEGKVGLIPGGGGTQRLPRLIGAQAAAPLLLQGKSLKVAEAQGLGVIHDSAPSEELIAKAKAWVLANPNAKAPWDEKKFRVPGGVPNQHPGASQAFTMGNAMMMKETKGNYPAQKAIMSAVYEGLQLDIDNALAVESRYFFNVATTPEAQGMIRTLFQSLQDVSKGASRPQGYEPYDIKKVAVIGAGLMGAGVAYVQAMAGIETILIDTKQESADRGKNYSEKLVEKAVSRGKTTIDKGAALLELIKPTTDYSMIEGADLVIEAVFENPGVKSEVIKAAEAKLSDTAVMGSNTSTIPITLLAENSVRPANFIGIHFFSPVEKMGLVEIIVGKETSEETLAKAIDYVLKIRKTPITVNDHRGFYTSRCFSTYTEEGLEMLTEGIAPAIIENVGRQTGMPMGPLEVSDSVGLDTFLKIGRETASAEGRDFNASPTGKLMSWIVEDKARVGRKAGKGFYDYNEKGHTDRIWQGLTEKAPVKFDECPPEMKEELSKRLLIRQCIEVARCFEEGVITDARDADVGSILAWGFAPYSGGCVSYMDLKWGLKEFVAEADRLTAAYGARFEPPVMLREMALKGETFYERFPPQSSGSTKAA
ncbi:MAG: 3-hydroxyacyl-CoA dehydrogenase [Hirschia sp.]|nr:3-hydroxyacyl-CoA dehydrogenase [Hirschia sp.]MBF19703.1 3-hydroxyacyl-CoA dehydrogenase [Hirschia sp.]